MLVVGRRRFVLSPHLDDAVFSCWHIVAGPTEVEVVTLFAGVPEPGGELPRWDRITGARDPAERVRERLDEDREALALAGRRGTYLDFVEAQYGNALPSVDELAAGLGDVSPLGEVVAPAGIGGHSAHLRVRALALRLADQGSEVSFYAELPYATEFGWPAWVTGEEADPVRDVDAAWRVDAEPLYVRGYEPCAVTLDEQLRKGKLDAMSCYRSQLAALDAGPQRRLTHPELVRYEVIWRKA